MGIYEDANITTNQFSLLVVIFYAAMLVFELPSGYAIQRLPSAKYLGASGEVQKAGCQGLKLMARSCVLGYMRICHSHM